VAFRLGQRVQLGQHGGTSGAAAARERAGRVEQVAVVCYALHQYVAVKGDSLGGGRILLAHEGTGEGPDKNQ
jgi:hypothetical protein